MTLRLRLVLGLAAVAVLLAAPLALASKALHGAQMSARRLGGEDVGAALLLGRTRDVVQNLSDAEDAVLFLPDSADGAGRMARATRDLAAAIDSLEAYDLPIEVAALRTVAARLQVAAPLQVAAMRGGRPATADSISTERIGPAVRDAERSLVDAEQRVRARAEHTADSVRDDVAIAFSQSIVLFVAGAAGAMAVSVWLTRSVSAPVRELASGMEAVASGRFDHALRLAPSRRDEFGALAANFATMTRRLAELDRLRAEFVSVASHELKTPLNVILGYVALVGEGLYGPVTPEQRGVLEIVEGQTRHLTRLVQRLLDVSRFQAGAGAIHAQPLALGAFLADLERAHRVLAEQRQLTFALVADPALPETVRWDADRMAEVLGNLVSNAVKFTPPGGRVTLTAEPCPDFGGAGADGTAVRLCVEDTGVGIAPEQLPHIFDKFYQANNQARASAAGSGLGLAITKQIVEAHGGVIGAESTPDVGTRFVLLLPLDATGLASTAFGPLSEAERADVTPAVASVLGASHSAASDGAASVGAAPAAAASASAGGTRA